MIKHISFDLWGTLITSNPNYRDRRNKLLEEIFHVDLLPDELRRGKVMVDEISELTGRQLDYPQTVTLMLGLNTKWIDRERFLKNVELFRKENTLLVREDNPLFISPQIPFLLNTLKQCKISMSILSNTSIIPGSMLRDTLKILEIHDLFSFMIFSDEVGYAKPNKTVYRMLFENVIYKSNEIFHVGDNPYSDSGAGIVSSFIITERNPIINLLKLIQEQKENEISNLCSLQV